MRKVGWSDHEECGTPYGKTMYDFDIRNLNENSHGKKWQNLITINLQHVLLKETSKSWERTRDFKNKKTKNFLFCILYNCFLLLIFSPKKKLNVCF
jgi:hypothetical protein